MNTHHAPAPTPTATTASARMHCPECGAIGPTRPTTTEAEADAAWHDHQHHGDRPTAVPVP